MTQSNPSLPNMVFVSGPHRSGTTFLHQWLADTGRFSYVTPFDIIHFDQLRAMHASGAAAEKFAALDRELRALPDRGLDACGVGAGVAEEYGFLLPKAGDYSFFTPSLTEANRPRFEALRQIKAELDPRPLVLKNPDDHYFNFAAIQAWYPESRFIFTHRHPLVVLNSQAKAWIGMLERENAYFAKVSGFYRAVMAAPAKRMMFLGLLRSRRWAEQALEQLLKSIDYYVQHVATLPAAQVHVLRYEDLCRDPAGKLGEVHAFLGLPAPGPAAATAVRPRPVKLLPHIEEVFNARASEAAPRLAALGYEVSVPVAV